MYNQHDPAETILAGFSFGAMTALVTAAARNPIELWLFSISSFFAEDLISEYQKKSWLRMIGTRRQLTFGQLHFAELADRINCKTLIFYGQIELDDWPIMNERALDTKRRLKYGVYVAVPEVGHDVANEHYIKAITETI